MRALHLLLATALVANNSGAQTPLTVDTNFRFYYTPDILEHWTDVFWGGNWQPGIGDLVLRHDGNLLAVGLEFNRPDEIPNGEDKSLILDPLDGSVQEFLCCCGGHVVETGTDQYFWFGRRFFYDCGTDYSFHPSHIVYQSLTDGWFVLPDRSAFVLGCFRITADDPLRYVLIKVDQWGALDPSFTPRSASNSPNLGGTRLFQLANGQYLFNGTWGAYEGRPCGPVIRIDADGAQDTTFAFVALIAHLAAIHEQPDGKVIMAGQFMLQEYFPDTLNLIRVNVDGTLDHSFYNLNHVTMRSPTEPVISTARFAGVNVLEPLDAGRYVIGGQFTHIDEERRGCIACVDTAGNLLDCWANGGLVPLFYTPSGYATVGLSGYDRLVDHTYIYGKYKGFIDADGLHPEQCMVSRMYMPDVGVREQSGDASDVDLWPNPGSEELNIRIPGTTTGTFALLDLSGRVVREGTLRPGITTMDASAMPSGVYVLRVTKGNGTRTTLKWIKQ